MLPMKLHVTSPISMLVGFSHTHKRAREDEADVARRTDGANDSDITPLSQPPNSRMRSPRLQEARNALWIGISAHLRRSVQIARWDPKRVARVAATIGAPFVGHHHGAHTVPRQAAWLSQKGWARSTRLLGAVMAVCAPLLECARDSKRGHRGSPLGCEHPATGTIMEPDGAPALKSADSQGNCEGTVNSLFRHRQAVAQPLPPAFFLDCKRRTNGSRCPGCQARHDAAAGITSGRSTYHWQQVESTTQTHRRLPLHLLRQHQRAYGRPRPAPPWQPQDRHDRRLPHRLHSCNSSRVGRWL